MESDNKAFWDALRIHRRPLREIIKIISIFELPDGRVLAETDVQGITSIFLYDSDCVFITFPHALLKYGGFKERVLKVWPLQDRPLVKVTRWRCTLRVCRDWPGECCHERMLRYLQPFVADPTNDELMISHLPPNRRAAALASIR